MLNNHPSEFSLGSEKIRKKTKKEWLLFLLLIVLSFSAFVSVVQGFISAYYHSQDFQWSPAVILSHGENPYQVLLNGDPKHEIILSQQPSYLHFLYICLLPLTSMKWEVAKITWAIVNFGFALLNILMVVKIFNLRGRTALLLALLFLTSTPFRNGLSNGQHQELVLMFFLMGVMATNIYVSAVLTGISYLKYSFAPAIAQALWFRYGTMAIAMSLLGPSLGVIIFSLIVHQNPLLVLLQPLLTSAKGISPGAGDLMTIIERIISQYPQNNPILEKAMYYFLPLISSLGVGLVIHKKSKNAWETLAYTSISSLMFIKHLSYDYVFLLPAAALVLRSDSKIKKSVIGLGIFYHWYLLKILDLLSVNAELLLPLSFSINLIMLTTIFYSPLARERSIDSFDQSSIKNASIS